MNNNNKLKLFNDGLVLYAQLFAEKDKDETIEVQMLAIKAELLLLYESALSTQN